MIVTVPHSWGVTCELAVTIQEWLRSRVSIDSDIGGSVSRIATVILSTSLTWPVVGKIVISVHTWPSMVPSGMLEVSGIECFNPRYPRDLEMFSYGQYICDMLKAVNGIDMIIANRSGIDHPRYLGIASHIGLITSIPTISIVSGPTLGKNVDNRYNVPKLVFEIDEETRLAASKLEVELCSRVYGGDIGAVTGGKYVSAAHGISVESACEIISEMSDMCDLDDLMRGKI